MKVSIITPSYQQAVFIERTLKSVANQNYAELEHVVFDGGSTDGTVEILKNFKPQVRWVSQKDKGQADAVNQGIANSDGDVIGWLNSDDIYYHGAISCIVDYFHKHPEADVVYGMADHIDKMDTPIETYPTEPWDFNRLKDNCFICQPALFFRRAIVKKHGLLDDSLNYCMDYEYWLRLGKAGVRFHYLERKIAGSRLYQENKTLGSRVKVHKEINDALKNQFGKVPDRWIYNYAHSLVESKVDREKTPRLFILLLLVSTIKAALHWNNRISNNMVSTMAFWTWSGKEGPRNYSLKKIFSNKKR
jgi:glycosyltransferase involved in cell wall biosynthesis